MSVRAETGSPSSSTVPLATNRERDEQLLAKVAARDREAFRQLYQIYHRRLARFLIRITRRQEIAEEIINDTLWVVWNKAAAFRGNSAVSTWIMGIAYRRGLKTLRRLHTTAAAMTSLDVSEALTADESSEARDRDDWLACALAQLPVEQRMVLELAYYFGHSYEEIGEIMSCPVNTVKTRMFHARRKLKVLLPGLER
jgi:RNA polymerase sigma-70 factor, ECF subfamily